MKIQLEMFEESQDSKELKPIDYSKPIGMYKELKDVRGIENMSEKGLELLHYLYTNHARAEDGFIHAKQLAGLLGFWDTRELRKLCAEIDFNTELVVYASQNGYKLASTPLEIEMAVKFALAPTMTSIKRVFAKNKEETLHWLHGFLTNLEKEFGGVVQGQQQIDENLEQRGVSHYPDQPFKEHVLPIGQRIQAYVKSQDSKRK
jgi:hypothetical protein